MDVEFTAIMPTKGELEYLPYSLPSVFALEPSEVIVLSDDPGTAKLAAKIAKKLGYEDRLKVVELWKVPSEDWRCRIAFARRYGFRMARHDVILNTDADTVLDPKIKQYIPLVGRNDIGLVSFRRVGYPPGLRDAVNYLAHVVLKLGFDAIYAFYRPYWAETESMESLKRVESAEDTHLCLSMRRKYKVLYVKDVKNLDLRRVDSPERQLLDGRMKYFVEREPLAKVLAHSLLYVRPRVVVGYLKAKYARGI